MPEGSSPTGQAGERGPERGASPTRRERPVVGVSLLTADVEFHRALGAGLRESARAAGLELVVTVADYSPAVQDEQLAAFLGAGRVDAVLLTPCDSASAGAPIERANRLGVPVFTADVAAIGEGRVVSHIASDNLAGGRRAGALMDRLLGGEGLVAILTHPGITSVTERNRGFRQALAASDGVRVVGELPVWRHTRARSTDLVRRLLAGAAMDGLFCVNSELTLGAAEAIEAAGLAGRVVVVGFDGSTEVEEAIRRGRVHGEVVQHPEAIAALAIGAIRDHLAGRPVPPVILAEVGERSAAEGAAPRRTPR